MRLHLRGIPCATIAATLCLAAVVPSGEAVAADWYSGGGSAGGNPRMAPDANNFTDLRLGVHSLPRSGVDASAPGGSFSGDFDSGSRISLMIYGPVCSLVPINCFTPARIDSNKKLPATIEWGDSEGWNFLGGMEASLNRWSTDEDTAAGKPGIDYQAVALTAHVLGLGTEYRCFGSCRWQIEGNPFVGIGWSRVSLENAGASSDQSGVYYELGARLGMFLTLPFGLQVGAEARYLFADSKLSGGNSNTDVSVRTSGLTGGASVGYRF